MNRKRWIYAGALGIAVAAFVIDRLFLGAPQSAEARQISPDPKAARPASARAKKAQNQPLIADPSLAWLEKLATTGTPRDVFAPPDWLEKQRQEAEAAAAAARQAEGPQPGSAEAFEAAHRLQATTVMGNGGLAVVDHQCLSVGETLDGFRLARVEAGWVQFVRGAERATLSLPTPPAPSARRLPAAGAPPDGMRPASTPAAHPTSGWDLLRRLWKP